LLEDCGLLPWTDEQLLAGHPPMNVNQKARLLRLFSEENKTLVLSGDVALIDGLHDLSKYGNLKAKKRKYNTKLISGNIHLQYKA
jgi:hypothetical protein